MIILLTSILLLTIPPLVGLLRPGIDLAPYLEFPPVTRHIQIAPFSLTAFLLMALFIVAVCLPGYWPELWLKRRAPQKTAQPPRPSDSSRRFPLWGRIGLGLLLLSWLSAWTRPAFLGPLAAHTFTPLWFGFILFLDGLVVLRKGESMLTRSRRGFFLLFPISAVAWWFFEYLNRFVQNWYYEGVAHFTPLEYFLLATPPFATVLPAVFESAELLGTFPLFQRRYRQVRPMGGLPKWGAWLLIASGVLGLTGISFLPNLCYPLLWLAPLLIICPLLQLSAVETPFTWFSQGDWRGMILLSLGALFCGFFWEMWNFHSLPKWHYAVPYVQTLPIFEMPLLGFAGYLPFGIECYCLYALVQHAFRLPSLQVLRPGDLGQ